MFYGIGRWLCPLSVGAESQFAGSFFMALHSPFTPNLLFTARALELVVDRGENRNETD